MSGADPIKIYCSYSKLIDISELKPNPKNNNIHPDNQIEKLAKLIQDHGWRIPITVSNQSGYIVRGHGKLMAAKSLGATKIPVDFQDYESPAKELADLVADNKIPELSFFDDDLTRDLFHDIKEMDIDFDMELTGFGLDEVAGIFSGGENAGKSSEDLDNVPEAPVEPKSKLGDLYQLGRHKLLCGDATKREDVERLIGKENADMVEVSSNGK